MIHRRKWMALIGGIGAIAFLANAQDLLDVEMVKDGEAPLYRILAEAPGKTMVTLERSGDLEPDEWSTAKSAFLGTGSDVWMEDAPNQPTQFYRARYDALSVLISNQGDTIYLELGSNVTFDAVAECFRGEMGCYLYPTDADDIGRPMPSGVYTGATVEAVMAAAGFEVWCPPPAEDDEAYADKFLLPERDQDEPSIVDPGETGTNTMEDGYAYDPSAPDPEELEEGLDPTGADMPYDLDVPGMPEDHIAADDLVPPVNDHVRLILQATETNATLTDAVMLSGFFPTDAESPRLAGEGDVVFVVRYDPGASGPFIQHFGVRTDPWVERVYYPPGGDEGTHGDTRLASVALRLPAPLEPGQSHSNLLFDVLMLLDPPEDSLLTSDYIEDHPDRFRLLASFTGAQIDNALNGLPEPMSRKRGESYQPLSWGPAPGTTSTVTMIHGSLTDHWKQNIMVIGDGFAATNQGIYINLVNTFINTHLLGADEGLDIRNAFNVARVNAFSTDSGVTQVDSNGVVTLDRATALDYRYSGIWGRAWMEKGPNTDDHIKFYVDAHFPQADYVLVILNEFGGGGNAGGSGFRITRALDRYVTLHELGHMYAKVADEYGCQPGSTNCIAYTNQTAKAQNLEGNRAQQGRASLKWSLWVPPFRPIPTSPTNIALNNQDVGAFETATIGTKSYISGLYRPTRSSRMNSDVLPNPIARHSYMMNKGPTVQRNLSTFKVAPLQSGYLIPNHALQIWESGRLSLFTAGPRLRNPVDPVSKAHLRPDTITMRESAAFMNFTTNGAPGVWSHRFGDAFYPARSVPAVYRPRQIALNFINWNEPYLGILNYDGFTEEEYRLGKLYKSSLPGWELRPRDRFYTADVGYDSAEELIVFNGQDWDVPHLAIYEIRNDELKLLRRYDKHLGDGPAREMGRSTEFHFADFDGDGYADILAHCRTNWQKPYLFIALSRPQTSGGTNSYTCLSPSSFYGHILAPLNWTMAPNDVVLPMDFSGDGVTDLVLFNGQNWNRRYLGMFRGSTNGTFTFDGLHDSVTRPVPGWKMMPKDRFVVGDFNGDGRQDLSAFNAGNWDYPYLGILRSVYDANPGDIIIPGVTKFKFTGTWQKRNIGNWYFGEADRFIAADYGGNEEWTDLYIMRKDRFGLLRSVKHAFQLEGDHPNYLWPDYRYHALGWW